MSWLAGALAALAVLWARPARARGLPAVAAPAARPAPVARGERSGVRLLGAVGCGAAAWVFVGGPVGPLAGLVVALAVHRLLGRAEPPSVVRRRERLERELPTAVDLLAACLRAGAAPGAALRTVGRAVGGPVREELDAVAHRLDLGADPAAVWAQVAEHGVLGPLGRALERAHESGSSVTDAVDQLAEDLRAEARTRVEERARTLEVKVAAPLGLCLLPAFVVLGIVPLVAGIVGSLGLAP